MSSSDIGTVSSKVGFGSCVESCHIAQAESLSVSMASATGMGSPGRYLSSVGLFALGCVFGVLSTDNLP